MPYTRPQRYANYAEEKREGGQFDAAGEYYVSASHGWFMRFRYLPDDLPEPVDVPANSPKHLGRAIQDLLSAILCFRLGGNRDRGRNYSEIGIKILEDISNYEGNFLSTDARKGLLHEMLGDLRLFGNLDSPNPEYMTAKEFYENVNSPRGWQSEPEFDSMIRLCVELADSIYYEMDENTRRTIVDHSLTDRIEFKQKNYRGIVEKVLSSGNW